MLSSRQARWAGGCFRLPALRSGGFLGLKFIRSTNVEPCTNVQSKYFSHHHAKLLLSAAPFFGRFGSRSVERWQEVYSFASFGLCVGFVWLANVCAYVLAGNSIFNISANS